MSIKDMVKNKVVKFLFYKEGELWYVTECGFEFPVPISDCGTASMNASDKAILFMRWIRKQIDVVNEINIAKATNIESIQRDIDADERFYNN